MNYSKKGLRLTDEEYDLRLKKYNLQKVDNYINSVTSIKHACIHCNKIFKAKPKELNRINCDCVLKGTEYKQKVLLKNIILLENYKNIRSKLLHKCLNCNNEFKTTPKTVLQSKIGCSSCSGKKFTEEKYKSLLPKNIELKGKYVDSSKHTLHKCLECGYEWNTKPNYIIHMGCGCPRCTASKGEKLIQSILDELSIQYIKEKEIIVNNNKYRFDFFLEVQKVIIEYDGIQHFESRDFFGGQKYLEKVKKSDHIKNEWCISNNYKIIRFSYKDLKEQISKLIYSIKKDSLHEYGKI